MEQINHSTGNTKKQKLLPTVAMVKMNSYPSCCALQADGQHGNIYDEDVGNTRQFG